jgi:hypothetical protein
MARHLLDYDPLNREAVYFDYNEGAGKVTITHSQDITPVIELAQALAKDENRTKKGIKQDMWHYAKVPSTIIVEMKQKHGVDFFDKNDWPRVFKLLNTEYPYLKTTHKNHSIKHA